MITEQSKNIITLTSTPDVGYTFIHVIEKVNYSPTLPTLINSVIDIEESITELILDGYYLLKEWKLPDTSNGGYYATGGVIYNSSAQVVTVEELLLLDLTTTNIVETSYNQLLYYFLQTYYIDLINNKFLKGICNCNCVSSQDRMTIDTLTMGLEVLRILEEDLQYYEAMRIIDNLSVCNSIIDSNCNCNG